MVIKSIPQAHDGILYRSRTEARWGEFFSLAEVPFEYEPEGFDLDGEWYVPDFRLAGRLWFEVKGTEPTARERDLAERLARDTQSKVIIAVGNPGAGYLLAFGVNDFPTRCYLVEEFRQETGAWIAEFLNGGGWAEPLCAGLVNCSATGLEHCLLVEAGRLQFRTPAVQAESVHIASVVSSVMATLDRRRRQ